MGLLLILLAILSIPLTLMAIHIIDLIKSLQEKEKCEDLLSSDENYVNQFIYNKEWYIAKENIRNAKTCIIGYIIASIIFLMFIIWFVKSCNEPYKYPDSMRDERVKIEYKLSYYDNLFYDYIEEAKQYNYEVNRSNIKFIRFKLEDRTEYMIDIDYYMTEFNNHTTTSTTTTD